MLAERPMALANASVFDRILILPTSRPPANSPVTTTPPPFSAPQQRPIQAQPMPDMDDPSINQQAPGAAPMPPGVVPNTPPGVVPNTPPGVMPNMPPQTQPGQPGQPGAPLTAPRPGQLPAPQQPVPFGGPPKPPGGGGGGGGGAQG
jgi:hypothetical protein